jgi:atypical dual specificity phosphatase
MTAGSRRGKHTGTVIIDCCNLTVEKRKEWRETCHNLTAWCIFFDIDMETCRKRIMNRRNHPTIGTPEKGIKVLKTMEKVLERPRFKSPMDKSQSRSAVDDEGFERVIVIKSEEDVLRLLQDWGIVSAESSPEAVVVVEPLSAEEKPSLSSHSAESQGKDQLLLVSPLLLKFPRTPHAINLGSATRDDKILSPSVVKDLILQKQKVYIEEKLDGANMGISIDETGCFKVQNRSHFVSSR